MAAALLCSRIAVGCSGAESASGDGSGGGGRGGSGGDGSGAAPTSSSTVGDPSSSSAASASSTGAGGGAPGPLTGYWVWTKQIDGGQVILEVTDADMEPKVGASGWPGCPDGILCTHYGIHKVAFGATGRFHYQLNVSTSSDFQTLGGWSGGANGHGTFERFAQFSCAHPEQLSTDMVPGGFRHEMVDGELRIGVTDFGSSFPFYDDGTEPTRWIAYKLVSREDYYGKYMIRVCQPHDGYECYEACFDDSLVDEQ